MQQWDNDTKFYHWLSIWLVFDLLSCLMPWRLQGALNATVAWLTTWWPLIAVVACAVLAYGLLAWAPKYYDWRAIWAGAVRVLYAVALATALTVKFWFCTLPVLGWLWVFVCLLIIAGLAANDTNIDTGADRDNTAATEPPFLVDAPLEDISEDVLGRSRFAEALGDAISAHSSAAPFTVAINGGWGTGKSTTMKFMRRHLERQQHKTCWVNVWLYDGKPAIWQAILNAMTDLFREYHVPVIYLTPIRPYVHAVGGLLKAAPGGLGKAVDSLLKDLPTYDELAHAKKTVSGLVQQVVGDGKKLFIFIDDLDRCSPENVLATFEVLREVMDFRHCVFVLGFDKQVVIPLLKRRYGKQADDFLHKVIQLTIDMNAAEGDHAVSEFSGQLAAVADLDRQEANKLMGCLCEHLGYNPRSIKQVLNGVLAVKEILHNSGINLEGERFGPALVGAELLRFKYTDVHSKLRDPHALDDFTNDARKHALSAQRGRADLGKGIQQAIRAMFRLESTKADDVAKIFKEFELVLGPFSPETLPMPKSVLFRYTHPPDWITEKRAHNLLQRVSNRETTLQAELPHLSNGADKAFADRCSRLKNGQLQECSEHGQFVGAPEFENDFLRAVICGIVGYQSDSGRVIIDRRELRGLIGAEARCLGQEAAIAFAGQLFAVMHNKDVYELISPDPMDKEFPDRHPELHAHYESYRDEIAPGLWDEFVSNLGAGELETSTAFFGHIRSLDFAPLNTPAAHQALVRAAQHNAENRTFGRNLITLLGLWFDWLAAPREEQAGRDIRKAWLEVVDRGLLVAIDQAVVLLQVWQAELFAQLRELEGMTQKFRQEQDPTGDTHG